MPISRRDLLAMSAVTTATLPGSGMAMAPVPADASWLDRLRPPDAVVARMASGAMLTLARAGTEWTAPGLAVTTEIIGGAMGARLPVVIESTRQDLANLHLRWTWQIGTDPLVLGDAWERAYADLGWRGLVPERVLPWYFLLRHGGRLTGFGVETQPNSFCFWQCDAHGVSLWLDLGSGGEPAQLAGRRLTACRITMAERPLAAPMTPLVHAFCRRLCPAPRLPHSPIIGSNDWNYAYGKNNADGILRDARLMAELAPTGCRPFVVIDDGWQDRTRFPDLAGLADRLRGAGTRPGIWIRPLRAERGVDGALLPPARFGDNQDVVRAYDPSTSSGLAAAVRSIAVARAQGYQFIKHDFSSYDLLGQWGRDMVARPARPGWRFGDPSRTTAEIVLGFYRALRVAAGDDCLVLGCNTFGHLAAGLFEMQRIGDDTSGKDWERTRRYGVNALAFRVAQHRAFFHADPDIVAVTRDVPWALTKQWLDVVARSGTSLFVAPQPDAITPDVKSALRAAIATAVRGGTGCPIDEANTTTPERWTFSDGIDDVSYRWCEPRGADPFA